MGDLKLRANEDFERIKQIDACGNEFWLARELSKILEYSDYRNFLSVIDRAKEACMNSAQSMQDHFEDLVDAALIGSGAKR